MNTFPDLDCSPEIQSWVEDFSDAVETAQFASGYPLLNKQFTFDPMTWQYTLKNVSQVDKDALMLFYQNNIDADFYWLNEQDSTVYEVVFAQKPSRRIQNNDNKALWQLGLLLRQSTPAEFPGELITRKFYGGDAMIEVENLAAGADINLRAAFVAAQNMTVISLLLMTKGTPTGIDNSNTVVMSLKNKNNDVVWTKTFNAGTQPPTNDAVNLSEDLDGDYTELDKGDVLDLTVTQGATANMPAFAIVLGGYYR